MKRSRLAVGTRKELTRRVPFSKRGEALIGQEMFKVLDKARMMEEKGIYIYHLELGNPRNPAPRELLEATVGSLRKLDLGYTSSAGLPELRRALANRYTRLAGRTIHEENIVISPANLLISQFLDLTCDPGDRVVLFTPAFPTYLAATAHMGLDVVDVPLDMESGFDLTEERVKAAIKARPKAILVNSANNPTGSVYTREVLNLLARLCDREGIWLLSDETYAELCFARPFYSLATLEYPRIVIISSFSKIFSIPGFRTGFAVAHESVAEKIALSSSTLISCLPAFTQRGCLAGLFVLDSYMTGVKERFAWVVQECTRIINESGVLCCSVPQSGFYIFIDISPLGEDDMSFSNRLLEEKRTAVTPGRSFGEAFKTFIRVAVCEKYEDVTRGLEQVISLARDLRG